MAKIDSIKEGKRKIPNIIAPTTTLEQKARYYMVKIDKIYISIVNIEFRKFPKS